MPILLANAETEDQEAEALDIALSDAEVNTEMERLARAPGEAGDLSYGGRVGEVNVHPNPTRNSNGNMVSNGRPNARSAWTWDGTPTTLPLGWNPEGTQHNGARPHLAKKHCHCCGFNGFRITSKTPGCPMCTRNNCRNCQGGRDRSKIIPCFYLRQDRVPYPREKDTSVDCFLFSCVRRGGNGFKDEADMRLHGRTKHRQEYQSYLESQRSTEAREVDQLRQQVAVLTTAVLSQAAADRVPPIIQRATPPKRSPKRSKPPVGGTPERPLYVSDKDKESASIQ